MTVVVHPANILSPSSVSFGSSTLTSILVNVGIGIAEKVITNYLKNTFSGKKIQKTADNSSP